MNMIDLAEAFVFGKPGRCHNAYSDGKTYTLHTSPIVRRVTPREYHFYWHGFYTVTTANHMNNVLRLIGTGIRVSYSNAKKQGQDFFVVKV